MADNRTATLEILLESSTNVLSEVVVTGTVIATERKAIATPITVITASEIEKRGITSLEQFFRGEVPGVIALDQGISTYSMETSSWTHGGDLGRRETAQMYARGSSNVTQRVNPLKTFVDGIEVVDAAYLGTIDPNTVERIEIITGPQAATIYGSGAMGGVMQIFTKKGQAGHREFIANFKYGVLQNNISKNLTPSHGHTITVNGNPGSVFSYTATLGYNYLGQWQPGLYDKSFSGSIGVTAKDGPITATASTSLRKGVSGTGSGASTAASPFLRVLRETGQASQINPVSALYRRESISWSQTQALNIDYRMLPSWQHHLTLGRNTTNFSLESKAAQRRNFADSLLPAKSANSTRTTVGYNTTAQAQTKFLSYALTLGLNGSSGDRLNAGGCLVFSESQTYIDCGPSGSSRLIQKPVNTIAYGGFGSIRIGVADQLFLSVGTRGERNPDYGDRVKVDWTPTYGLAYTLELGEATIKLLGSYGKATRSPGPEDRLEKYLTNICCEPSVYLSQLANPDLRPEYSRGPQGGVEVYWSNRGSISINRYKQEITDLLQRLHVATIELVNVSTGNPAGYIQWQWQNVANVAQHGYEVTASWRVLTIDINGTYTWADSRVKHSHVKSYIRGDAFLGLPTHFGNLRLTHALGKTSASLSVNFIGAALSDGFGAKILGSGLYRVQAYVDRSVLPSGRQRKPGYTKSDLALLHKVTSKVSIQANINNLWDNYHSDTQFPILSPSLGRKTLIGVSLRL